MKLILYIIFLLFLNFGFAQNQDSRIQSIKNQLELLSVDNAGLSEQVKSEIQVSNITLSNYLMGLSEIHGINLNIASDLNQISVVNNFSNVTVSDLLVFLCKEYGLTIDFSGNILSIKTYKAPIEIPEERIIPVAYDPLNNTLSIDAKNDKLYDTFKRIMDESGKNLVFSPGLESKSITFYIKDTSFDAAMDKLALANNLYYEKTNDNFYLFDDNSNESSTSGKIKRKTTDLQYTILDTYNKTLEVDFKDVQIADIIEQLAQALNLNIFTASPLEEAGTITFKTKSISFDELLLKIFESQKENEQSNSQNTNTANKIPNNANQSIGQQSQASESNNFTFKKENNVYYFGTEKQLSVRAVEIIHLQHRSVELLSDPLGGGGMRNRTVGRTNSLQNSFGGYNNFDNFRTSSNSGSSQFRNNNTFNNPNRTPINTRDNNSFNNSGSTGEALLSVLPEEVVKDLEIKVDFELNSFYVTGTGANIERFKAFVRQIDKPVPVILIEVMLIEFSRNATIESGVSWGVGDAPVETKGSIFPTTDLTIGANRLNKVLNGFDGFGQQNIGKLIPNFFATIKAMEANGNLKIKSTPKLATLNGHRATFSNGQTSYYAVTQRNIFGADNPQTSEITNYEPIDAELGLTIKPMVSGDGQVTLDIFVVQSSFGTRIADDAPPDLSSREFTSIIRVKDQDIVVLGGLEEQEKNDSGSGVPFLARVPVIKWLFSSRKRTDSKAKLSVLIKPTVIY